LSLLKSAIGNEKGGEKGEREAEMMTVERKVN
jgi:hypothetical protein